MPSVHVTVQGETWDSVARQRLGSEKRMHLLLAANPAHAKDLVFSAGARLVIPDVAPLTEEVPLPPWKR